jgi:hypothetical protein
MALLLQSSWAEEGCVFLFEPMAARRLLKRPKMRAVEILETGHVVALLALRVSVLGQPRHPESSVDVQKHPYSLLWQCHGIESWISSR